MIGNHYERLLRAKKDFHGYGIALIVVSLVTISLVSIKGASELRYPAFVMFMLGMYCFALANFQHRLAIMQAALDMKTVHTRTERC